MIRKIIAVALLLVLAVSAAGTTASGASGCSVRYYYTSGQNPEGVPAATTGVQSGSKWLIKPAGPSRTVYAKNKNGKTLTYTFDGWYANMNCRGTKYLPGRETTALVPVRSSGGYTVSLYGRWVYSDGTTAARAVPKKEISAKSAARAPAKQTNASSEQTTGPAEQANASAKPAAASGSSAANPKDEKSAKTKDEKSAITDQSDEKQKKESAAAGAAAQNDAVKEEQVPAEPKKEPVTVNAMNNRSRAEVLTGWRHLLIDTFFHINGRKYSYAEPSKYWTDSRGAWSGKTGKKGNTQSCVTLTTVSLKRTGIISPGCGSIWFSSNNSTKPNDTVKKLKKSSPFLTIFYPHKSLKHMAAKGMIKYGDILCRSGHTFVYMGVDSGGHPLIYESGSHRDIGNGTAVTWGHHSGGHANKLTGKINKQIKKSNAIGDKWRRGEISDAAFAGHRASGNNLNKPVHIVCSIRTFTVRTSCTDGTITPGNTYMAGENVNISYAPAEGMKLDSVNVDGKSIDLSKYGSAFSFPRISSDHQISVVYKQNHEEK
ncbi:MAG: hypothetical protein IJH22_05480 [Firmicutes bacterium]|nr:hypothetical protein [Bacillota bacterium]